MTFELRVLSDADLVWPDRGDPSFYVGAGAHKRAATVHPKRVYTHDIELVRDTLARCEEASPLTGSPGSLCVLDRDFDTGFNGRAMPDAIYERPDGSDWNVDVPCACGCGKPLKMQGLGLGIALAGKAVPQHPGWTRYLVGHEYGHCAWYHSRRIAGWSMSDARKAEVDYMRVRGHDNWIDGKQWHQLAVEIIANDWRVIIGRIEPDFWQHDVPKPTGAIVEWWERARELSKRGLDGDNHEFVKSSQAATSTDG